MRYLTIGSCSTAAMPHPFAMTQSESPHPLASWLADTSPATLLIMGSNAGKVAAAQGATGHSLDLAPTAEMPTRRFAAILLSTDYAVLEAAGWTQLLGQLRIHVSPRLWVMADATHALADGDYRALGFTCLPGWAGWRCYAYDLYSYKTTPDWLNARYWAHPERWEP